jgi:triphosphoribosyl-dephospho-CoA synthase
LIRAAESSGLDPAGVRSVVQSTTVQDAVRFYESFEYVSVSVDDPPAELQALDVRRGGAAADAIRERDVSLIDVMELSAPYDGVAQEWVGGFTRSFRASELIQRGDGTVLENAASCFLELLAEEPDTFITKQHDEETAHAVTDRAASVLAGESTPAVFADELVDEEINPGTTADIIASGLFIALERGMVV